MPGTGKLEIINGRVYCPTCGSEMTHENGYWLCSDKSCAHRFYGDPGHKFPPLVCSRCRCEYSVDLKYCPRCGLTREDGIE